MRLLSIAILSLGLASTAEAGPKSCPPGLAKQTRDCLPPGQARKQGYRVGDRIERDHVVLTDPYRYGLDERGTYWRVGDRVYQVDRETGEILTILGALTNLMN